MAPRGSVLLLLVALAATCTLLAAAAPSPATAASDHEPLPFRGAHFVGSCDRIYYGPRRVYDRHGRPAFEYYYVVNAACRDDDDIGYGDYVLGFAFAVCGIVILAVGGHWLYMCMQREVAKEKVAPVAEDSATGATTDDPEKAGAVVAQPGAAKVCCGEQ